MLNTLQLRERRKRRTRIKLRKSNPGRTRLTVFRSNKQIYAQIIDDRAGETLASASTMEKDLRGDLKSGGNRDGATKVGQLIAERALAKGVTEVVFDRGPYLYHGRVKALADAAREAGLKF